MSNHILPKFCWLLPYCTCLDKVKFAKEHFTKCAEFVFFFPLYVKFLSCVVLIYFGFSEIMCTKFLIFLWILYKHCYHEKEQSKNSLKAQHYADIHIHDACKILNTTVRGWSAYVVIMSKTRCKVGYWTFLRMAAFTFGRGTGSSSPSSSMPKSIKAKAVNKVAEKYPLKYFS